MCVYSMIADWAGKYAPWPQQPPQPPAPYVPWTWPQYNELQDILRRVKDMEDKLGTCPCEEPEKLGFLKHIKERLDDIDKKSAEKG